MSLSRHSSRRAGPSLRLLRPQCRRNYADTRPFAVGDHVILRPAWQRDGPGVLRGPLTPGKRIETHKGIIQHDDIIGKRVRERVPTQLPKLGKEGPDFRLQECSLDEYVRLSRRMVTPIYPADANLIVSLLDLHPDVYDVEDVGREKLEILEAGTGHGGLTLHLSRAIHAANPPRPKISEDEEPEKKTADIEAWKARRQAVIHTIDVAPQYSEHAEKTISIFRRGQYVNNIDFHVGSVSDWVTSTLPERNNEPFLSHAFLDLPNADTHVATVAEALKIDGTLIVFNPSITQITECILKIKQERIPLDVDTVIELGVNGGSGGREWDVRPVYPRVPKSQQVTPEPATEVESATEAESAAEEEPAGPQAEQESRDEEQKQAQTPPASEPAKEGKMAMVCRPKVGDRIFGGGFLAVFKKQRLQ